VDQDNVFIVGHSMGGVFAPILAAEFPVKGIAVYGTVVKTWTEYEGPEKVGGGGSRSYARTLRVAAPASDPARRRRSFTERLQRLDEKTAQSRDCESGFR